MQQAIETSKPYKVEVIADDSGIWAGNALRFETVEEAKEYGVDLYGRWILVREFRVVDTRTDEVMLREPS